MSTSSNQTESVRELSWVKSRDPLELVVGMLPCGLLVGRAVGNPGKVLV